MERYDEYRPRPVRGHTTGQAVVIVLVTAVLTFLVCTLAVLAFGSGN